MARLNSIQVIRTTRANLNTQASGSGLLPGEPYLITDESRFALALTTSTYQVFATYSDLTLASSSYQATAPSSPAAGQRWIDSTSGIEYVYVNDGDTSQWVEFGPSVTATGTVQQVFVQSTPPVADDAYIWFQTGLGSDGTGFTLWFEDGV